MARDKVLVLSALLIATLGVSAYALQFNVQISDSVETAAFDLEKSPTTDGLQEVNVTVENIGSIGCEFRLRGDFDYNDTEVSRFSKPEGLWPGETALLELYFIPQNYTGEVNSEVYLDYCGREEMLEDFNYTVESSNVPNKNFEAVTRSSNSTGAEIEFDAQEAVLVPEESPAGWKVGHAEVEEGKASLNYEPTLFTRDKNLTYTVVRGGEAVGTTEVSLKPERDFIDWMEDNLLNILLAASVIANLLLIFGRERLKQKLNL